MEEGKQTKKTIVSWAMIGVAFFAIIIFLFVDFFKDGKENATKRGCEQISHYVEAWGCTVNAELTSIMNAGKAYAEALVEDGRSLSDKRTLQFASALIDNTDISHILLRNSKGDVFDENGASVSGVDLSMYANVTEPTISVMAPCEYTDNAAAFCVCIPIAETGDRIFILDPFDNLADRFSYSTYEDVSFAGIMDKEGKVLGAFSKFKDTDSPYLLDGDILKAVTSGSDTAASNFLKSGLQSGIVCYSVSEYRNDARTIAFSPIGGCDCFLVFGVRQMYVDKLITNSFSSVKGTAIKLIVVIFVFTLFVVSTIVFNSLRTKERGRVLENKADTDLLTDLNNKAATERKIQEYLDTNPGGRAMMFILDIDNFKKINDTMGHAFGDTLLKTLGKEIRAEFRMSDIIGRTGGDEFMVFLKDVTDNLIVEREANRITRFFHDFKAGGDYVKYSATASIGAAIYPDDAKSFKDLYIAADQALYRAKKRGKNQLVFYNEASHTQI